MLMTTLALAAITGNPEYTLTGVARSRPAGGFVGASITSQFDDSHWSVGGYANYFYYWVDAGVKLDWKYLDGFLYFENWLGFEPGLFVFSGETEKREFAYRGTARSRLTVNYRPSWYWLYSRSTVEGRLRSFVENDIFRDAILKHELSLEQATATLFLLHKSEEDSSLWAYGEFTFVTELSNGVLDLRPSGGLLYENISPGLTLVLDIYYGLRPGIMEGLGALIFVWWTL